MATYVTEEYLDSRLESLEDRVETKINALENRLITKMDGMVSIMDGMGVILQRLDQERLFTAEWIRRIESDVSMVKKHLKLA